MIQLNKKEGEIFALTMLDNRMEKPQVMETSHDWEYLYKKAWKYEADADNFERFDVIVVDEEDPDDSMYYLWEEQDWIDNRIYYEYQLEHLEGLPRKEKMR